MTLLMAHCLHLPWRTERSDWTTRLLLLPSGSGTLDFPWISGYSCYRLPSSIFPISFLNDRCTSPLEPCQLQTQFNRPAFCQTLLPPLNLFDLTCLFSVENQPCGSRLCPWLLSYNPLLMIFGRRNPIQERIWGGGYEALRPLPRLVLQRDINRQHGYQVRPQPEC